jgi:hypothetical protein
MENSCSTKTITEVIKDDAKIICSSDRNDDGTNTPNLYHAEILSETKQINGVLGKEGELILVSENDSGEVGDVDNDGNLHIQLNEDDPQKYSKDDSGNLIYNM